MIKEFIYSVKRKDIIISLLILGVTFGYYLANWIPEGITSFKIWIFEIDTYGFTDIAQLAYYLKMKFLILFMAILWYLTCQHWWKSAILVIITIELFKLISSLSNEKAPMDEIDYVTSLPITLPIILLLVLISYKLNSYNLAKEVRSQIDNEIDNVFFEMNSKKNTEFITLKQNFSKIKAKKNKKNSLKYLDDLIALRNKFYYD